MTDQQTATATRESYSGPLGEPYETWKADVRARNDEKARHETLRHTMSGVPDPRARTPRSGGTPAI